jgi:multiple antibiotic resistance protein
VLVILVIVIFITLLNMSSDLIARMLGNQGIEILVRLMGLVLAAIAVQLTLEGIVGAITTMILPSLSG